MYAVCLYVCMSLFMYCVISCCLDVAMHFVSSFFIYWARSLVRSFFIALFRYLFRSVVRYFFRSLRMYVLFSSCLRSVSFAGLVSFVCMCLFLYSDISSVMYFYMCVCSLFMYVCINLRMSLFLYFWRVVLICFVMSLGWSLLCSPVLSLCVMHVWFLSLL